MNLDSLSSEEELLSAERVEELGHFVKLLTGLDLLLLIGLLLS